MNRAERKRKERQRNKSDEHRRASRLWRRNNRKRAIEGSAAWNAAHPERIGEHVQRFHERHPNYYRESRERCKLRKAWRKFVGICAAGRAQLAAQV